MFQKILTSAFALQVLYVCLASLHTVMVVSSDDNDKERMSQRKPNIVLFMSDDQDIMLGDLNVFYANWWF